MELEKLKLQAIAQKEKLVDVREVVSAHMESNTEPVSDDPNVMMEVVHTDDQAKKVVDCDDGEIVNVLKEFKAESRPDDCDVPMSVTNSENQAAEIFRSDYQAKRSLSKGRVVEQKAARDMLMQLGPILIDRYGRLLGEFSWIDDLRI
ncbi:hypothetical protein AgCh_023885 [Apium graveolens]